jgi:hypothetical protein
MNKMVELVFRAYKEKKDTIKRGWISKENIDWVTDHLMLKYLSDEELSEMWQVVHDYFRNETAELDGNNEIIGWKPDKMFEFDTESAWLEVINEEARRRKAMKNK